MDVAIRNENKSDYTTVEGVVREAFWNLYTPGCNEHFVLHNLRKNSDFIPELDFIDNISLTRTIELNNNLE